MPRRKSQVSGHEPQQAEQIEIPDAVPVEVADLDGIDAFALMLRHGMTELWGGNAHGKTRVQAAITDAAGNHRNTGVSVSDLRRDGNDALVGTVSVGSRQLQISRSGAVNRRGQMLAGLRIVDPGPVSRLIDPGLIEEEPRRAAQLRALLELVPLEVSEDNLRAVCVDPEVLAAAKLDAEQNQLANMLEATKRMRLAVQSRAREKEAERDREETEATKADGNVEAILATAAEMISGESGIQDAEKARAALAKSLESEEDFEARRMALERESATLAAEVSAYDREVRYRAELASTLGDEPNDLEVLRDLSLAKEGATLADGTLLLRRRDVAELEAKLQAAQVELARQEEATKALRASVVAAERRVAERQAHIARWREQKAKVDEVLPAPDRGRLEALKGELVSLLYSSTVSRMAAQWREAEANRHTRRAAAMAAGRRAAELREIERRAWERLGELVTATTQVPEITIQNGYVAYVAADGAVHDWNSKYVSDGQRNSAAFRLGSRCYGSGSILMIAGRVWESLDVEAKLALHRTCVEEQVFGLTEVASFSSDPLRAVRVGTPEWIESFRALLAAATKAAQGGDAGA